MSDESDFESPEFSPIKKKSDIEELRERNRLKFEELIASFKEDPEYDQAINEINSYTQNYGKKKDSKQKLQRRRRTDDSLFRFNGIIPVERRKSARLEHKEPIFTAEDLSDTDTVTFKRKKYYLSDDLEDLEDVVYRPKKSRLSTRVQERFIIKVEDVTQEMLNRIATRVKLKKYSEAGTSCHQCRQKTLDQKTCCRGEDCSGQRGQFCGVCILNRYGEDAAVALKDPNWKCFVCRGICNCSFCRAKKGKRPTGILTNIAQQRGFKSVKDLLDSLAGEGDYPEEDQNWYMHKNKKKLLGFSDDGRRAHMGNGVIKALLSDCKICIWNGFRNQENLLGFTEGGKTAHMGGNLIENIIVLNIKSENPCQ